MAMVLWFDPAVKDRPVYGVLCGCGDNLTAIGGGFFN
jgi:hypothetical protein